VSHILLVFVTAVQSSPLINKGMKGMIGGSNLAIVSRYAL